MSKLPPYGNLPDPRNKPPQREALAKLLLTFKVLLMLFACPL
jgi:hypothetical protein